MKRPRSTGVQCALMLGMASSELTFEVSKHGGSVPRLWSVCIVLVQELGISRYHLCLFNSVLGFQTYGIWEERCLVGCDIIFPLFG